MVEAVVKYRCSYHTILRDSWPRRSSGGKQTRRVAFAVTAIHHCCLEAEDRERRGPVICVITCSQRNHIIISEGDSGQTFHLKTVIVQMFNYFLNAKDDCKFVICLSCRKLSTSTSLSHWKEKHFT